MICIVHDTLLCYNVFSLRLQNVTFIVTHTHIHHGMWTNSKTFKREFRWVERELCISRNILAGWTKKIQRRIQAPSIDILFLIAKTKMQYIKVLFARATWADRCARYFRHRCRFNGKILGEAIILHLRERRTFTRPNKSCRNGKKRT